MEKIKCPKCKNKKFIKNFSEREIVWNNESLFITEKYYYCIGCGLRIGNLKSVADIQNQIKEKLKNA